MAAQKTQFPGVYAQESLKRRFQGRPDVTYYISYYDASKKRRYDKIGRKSEGITAALAAHVRADRVNLARLGHLAPRRQKNLTLAQAWEKVKVQRQWTFHQARAQESRFRNHIAPVLGSCPVSQITAASLVDIKNQLQSRKLAPATIYQVMGLVKLIINHLTASGEFDGPNPVAAVKIPKADNKRYRFLTADEAARLLERLRAKSETVWGIALLSLSTGMRAGEILALRGEQVDLERKLLRVLNTKNNQDRTVFLPGPALEMLRDRQPAPGQYVFGGTGRPAKSRVGNTFSQVVMEMGLNDGIEDRRGRFVFHSLRHTFASWQVQQGTPLYTVAGLLGHNTMVMTQRYAHLAPETRQAAVDAWETAFKSTGQPS